MQTCPHTGTSSNIVVAKNSGGEGQLYRPTALSRSYDPGSIKETWMVLLCASSIPVTFTLWPSNFLA